MSAIIVEGGLVHYEALGRGRPLLFLHDWLGSWRYWVPTMVDMASSHRTYGFDFWGFGDSDKAPARYDLESYTRQIELFLQQMGVRQVSLMIGHGLGAVIALRYAQMHPQEVVQVMAVSLPLSPRHMGRTLSSFTGDGSPARTILGRRIRAYEEVELEADKTDPRAVVQTVRSMTELDAVRILQRLTVPVLLVYGLEDPVIRPPGNEVLEQLDYHVHLLRLQGVHHYPMLDVSPEFNRLIRDFLLHGDNWDRIELKDEWKRRMR